VIATVGAIPQGPVHPQATLMGRVINSQGGGPLADVEIVFPPLDRMTRTAANGRFVMDSLPAGSLHVEVRLIGFEPLAYRIEVQRGDTLELEFTLQPTAQPLDSVTVAAPGPETSPAYLNGFERRRGLGLGEFLTRDQLRLKHDMPLSNVLRPFRSIRLTPRRNGGMAVVSRRSGGSGDCPLAVWVDGTYKGVWDPVRGGVSTTFASQSTSMSFRRTNWMRWRFMGSPCFLLNSRVPRRPVVRSCCGRDGASRRESSGLTRHCS